jgi:hypothetical protein
MVHYTYVHEYTVAKLADDAWIGGLVGKDGSFEWEDGSPVDYTAWNEGEPNGPSEECVELMHWEENLAADGKWNDIDCGAMNTVVCAIDLGT